MFLESYWIIKNIFHHCELILLLVDDNTVRVKIFNQYIPLQALPQGATYLGSRVGGLSRAPPAPWRLFHCCPSTSQGRKQHTWPAAGPRTPCWAATWSANSCGLFLDPRFHSTAPDRCLPTLDQPVQHTQDSVTKVKGCLATTAAISNK